MASTLNDNAMPAVTLISDRLLRAQPPGGAPCDARTAFRWCQLLRAGEFGSLLLDAVPTPGAISAWVDVSAIQHGTPQALLAAFCSAAHAAWREALAERESPPVRQHTIAVRYGGHDGPDLERIAAAAGLTRERVIELHAGAEYTVAALGFAPGFAYLDSLPTELRVPRRDSPRPRVPAGSVAIAGGQTAIYPHATPGGWHLIGRTDACLFDPKRTPPNLFSPGDRVRFVPLSSGTD
jgi:KipI family sensor histidine kinase inhibitor